MTPERFMDLLFHSVASPMYLSLRSSVIEFAKRGRKSITKQGLDSRFTKEAAAFVKLVLEEVIASQVSIQTDLTFLKDFKRVLIKDGTRFDLPAGLKADYKGCGGACNSEAGICIQYEFDIKSMKFMPIVLTDAKEPDKSHTKSSPFLAGDLIIRDLGYFSIAAFAEMLACGASFLSRMHGGVGITERNGDPFCFKTLYAMAKNTGQKTFDLEVSIGLKKNFDVRLVAELASDEEYRKRISALEKTAKRKGYQISDEARCRCRFFLLVTDIAKDKMTPDELFSLYRLRWQVELHFKCWKSQLGIHKVQKMNANRFNCLIYAKLIYIILSIETVSLARHMYYLKNKKMLSVKKCLDTLWEGKAMLMVIREAAKKIKPGILTKIFDGFKKNHWQEKKKNRSNFEDIYSLFVCKSMI